MALRKCGLCKKPFQDTGFAFCPACLMKMEDQFVLVRDFLYENPNAPIETVEEETGVPSRVIMHFLREGRLSEVNASGLLRCEQCGAPIGTGRFCADCSSKIDERMVKPIVAQRAKMEAKKKQEQDLSGELKGVRMHTKREGE